MLVCYSEGNQKLNSSGVLSEGQKDIASDKSDLSLKGSSLHSLFECEGFTIHMLMQYLNTKH